MTFPLMPHRLIEKAFILVKEEARILFRDNDYLMQHFEKTFGYYKRFWIILIGPANFSVFESFATTNNHSEGHNKILNKRMGNKHLNIWEFSGGYFYYNKLEI